MKSNRTTLIALAALVVACTSAVTTLVQSKVIAQAEDPNPIGGWFGIARPCPADATTDSPDHAAFCRTVCGDCPSIPGTLPPEVPMMPTLLADGTVLADDAGEINRFHTTAHGKWAPNPSGSVQIAGKQRFDAAFIWLQGLPPQARPGSISDLIGKLGGTCCFAAAVRPRFVTYFDPNDPDRMTGFIQPYFFPFVDPATGLVRVNPPSSTDTLAGNHIPLTALDPLGTLPACSPQNGCLGTYHFVIRRLKAF